MNNRMKNFIEMTIDEKINIIIRKLIFPIKSKICWKGNLGKNSLIRKPIMIHGKENIHIGNNTTIRNGARIEVISNWNGEQHSPQLVIGDNFTAEENLHIACADSIVIGHDVTISFDVMIMDNEHSFIKNKKIFETPLTTRPVSIGNYTFIGAGAKILKGVNIGDNCIIGAGAVVTKDIPSCSVAMGVPAMIKKIE